MCGIYGVCGVDSLTTSQIKKGLHTISHRGPDDEGIYQNSHIHLGFRRLSIIDLSPKGHQPMHNEDSTVWIIFNGEIYNYQELRNKLKKNHTFHSETDTEVLIHGYEEWGMRGLLKRINGMFGFAIYDRRKKKTYLVRDRIGKKPLYYFTSKSSIAFASEIKPFFTLKEFKFSINRSIFADKWLGFPYLPDNQHTIVNNIRKVPPGYYLEIDENLRTNIIKYWELPPSSILNVSFTKSVTALEELLIDSVNKRLIADVPIGILLSGGLDSSLITALASKHSKQKIRTITISFENSAINESKYANEVAQYCNTKHTQLSLSVKDLYGSFKKNIWIYDDLNTTDSGLFSTYLLSQEIRKIGVRVILVGEGADEIFGGYSWFQLSQYPFRVLPRKVQIWMYYYCIMRQLPNENFWKYSSDFYSLFDHQDESFLKQIQRYEITYSLPNHYCMKVDKGSMASSIEARAPYMDFRVVEYARSLPDEYLLNSRVYNPYLSNEKYILRAIARKYLPSSIYQRKKKGGMIPVYELLHQGLKTDKNLILKNQVIMDVFDEEYLKKLIVSQPVAPFSKWQKEWLLWKLLVFSLWYEHFRSI